MPKGQVWRELYEELRRGIEDGTYRAHSALPGVPHLMRTRGLSDSTVKRAFKQLKAEGLIEARQGAGHFVLPQSPAGLDSEWKAEVERRLARLEKRDLED